MGFVWAGLALVALAGALVVTAAVNDFRAGRAAWRALAQRQAEQRGGNQDRPWWDVGGHVQIALSSGALCCLAGIAQLLFVRPGFSPGSALGIVALTAGTALLTAAELTRHRLRARLTYQLCPPGGCR